MINVGIISCGSIAKSRHIPGIRDCKDARLAGFYNRTSARAQEYAEQYGGKWYETVDDMVADPDIDAVIVCSVTKLHCAHTVAALQAGKHVLCEKPMASNAKEAQAMVNAARQSGKKLMISHNQRRYHPHMKALELMDAGAIGKVLTFRTALANNGPEYSSVDKTPDNWYFDASVSSGAIADIGSHRIDLMCQFFGRPKRVFAHKVTIDKTYSDGRPIDLDDNAWALLEFENGVIGSFVTGWSSYNVNDRTTQIFGTEGVISTYVGEIDVLVETRSQERVEYTLPENCPQTVLVRTDIVEQFIRCIVKDTQPLITGEDGLLSIQTLDAMNESCKRGQWVDVKY